jgi:hypothetical protein
MSSPASPAPARVALVGDRSPHVRAHQRIPGLIDALCQREGLILDAYWIGSDEVTDPAAWPAFTASGSCPAVLTGARPVRSRRRAAPAKD